MDPIGIGLLGMTLVAFAVLAWRGATEDRLAVLALLIVTFGSPLLRDFVSGNVRWATALLSLALFLALTVLALRAERWWLLAAAGCQLIAVLSYVVAWMNPDTLIWSGVALRRVVWLELTAVALFGAWEAHVARNYAPGGRRHVSHQLRTSP